MTMRIRPDTLRSEIDHVFGLISQIKDRVDGGVYGEEVPANDINAEIFQYQLKGEIMLCSEKLASIAEVLE